MALEVEIAANQSTLARVDRIVERIEWLGDGTYLSTGELSCLRGVPTPGTNLTNLDGCPAEPANHRTTSFVLVPPASTESPK